MRPKPEKILNSNLRVKDITPFDIEGYIKENRNQIHARLILDYLGVLTSEASDFNAQVNIFLISNPINLEVLTLILGEMIIIDDTFKKQLISNRNALNARTNRKEKPSKIDLFKFKAEFECKYELLHGVRTCRGWKKAAQNFYKLDIKTINKIIE